VVYLVALVSCLLIRCRKPTSVFWWSSQQTPITTSARRGLRIEREPRLWGLCLAEHAIMRPYDGIQNQANGVGVLLFIDAGQFARESRVKCALTDWRSETCCMTGLRRSLAIREVSSSKSLAS